jgi:hypothetical protein
VTASALGGTVTTLASLPGFNNQVEGQGIATDGNYVYVATSGNAFDLAYTPVSGPTTTAGVLAVLGAPTPVTAGGGFVFWIGPAGVISAMAAP